MKICLVSFDFPPFADGGIAAQSYYLSLYLSKEGIDVLVLSAGAQENEVHINRHLNVVRLKIPINDRMMKIPTFQYKVWLWLKHNASSFDIIHFQENSGFIYYLFELFSRERNCYKHTIEHFHHSITADYFFQLSSIVKAPKENIPYLFMPLEMLQHYFCLKKAKSIITVSNNSRLALLSMGIDSKKITVIPNAIPSTNFKLKDVKVKHVQPIKFLYVGRLVPRKGIDILIQAIILLKKQGVNDFCVDIVGQGPLNNYVTNVIKKQDIKNCNVWGSVSQEKLVDLYDKADCFICPSRLEGFGIVLLEAATNGLTIIANNIPVFREIFSDEEVLFFRHNNPVDLANKISDLTKNKINTSLFKLNSYKRVKNFTWEKIINMYKKIYAQKCK